MKDQARKRQLQCLFPMNQMVLGWVSVELPLDLLLVPPANHRGLCSWLRSGAFPGNTPSPLQNYKQMEKENKLVKPSVFLLGEGRGAGGTQPWPSPAHWGTPAPRRERGWASALMDLWVIKSYFVHQLSLGDSSPCRRTLVLQNPDFACSWSVMVLHPHAPESTLACHSSRSISARNHRITELSNVGGWKGPLWVTQSNTPAKAGSPRAGCTGPCPGGSGISPGKETPQPPWAAWARAPSPSEGRSSSSCSAGTSSASICARCPLSCRWAPLERVWPRPPDTHPADICRHF